MFDIAWCDKYDALVLSLLYFVSTLLYSTLNSLVSGEHLLHLLLYKKETFVTFYITIRMCDNIWGSNSY